MSKSSEMSKINAPYLIQRLKKRNYDNGKKGFDAKFESDYMGSSEFEWGALPKSLKEICRNWGNYQIIQVDPLVKAKDGCILFIMGNRDNCHDYQKFIPDLIQDKFYLKENTYLKENLGGTASDYRKVDAWWDIENHVILLLGSKTEECMRKAIAETIEKKKVEGEREWFRE